MFPELPKGEADIIECLDEEEESFSRTLDRGEKLFEAYATKASKDTSKVLSGQDVWRLYDTFGFPVDLTRLMADENKLSINEAEFEEAQAKSKEASKATKKIGGQDLLTLDVHAIAELEKMEHVKATDDSAKFGKY